ncbi:MAG: protein kinase, partial [Syntrophaceae bacterium]|nr:protein kinase [Syntrophaceae bacterium]
GLSEAHDMGVIHRDLKPSNIMIDKQGNARIMDFGIARSLRNKGITGARMVIGTPEYMSPEQAEGKEVDQRSDIYSLGVILFEMVTGRLPFEGETALSIAQKHRYEPAPNPRTFNPHIHEDLATLILHCLEKNKETRYQTADEVLTGIEKTEQQILSTDRVTSTKRPFTSKEITVKFSPKKLLIPAIALVLIAAIAAIFLLRSPGGKKLTTFSTAKSIAVLPFTDLTQEKDQAVYCEGIAQWVLDSLSNMENLQVLARYSSFQFTAEDDPREVGKKLNVDKILTGSLWKSGDRLRITMKMVDAATGIQAWSEPFDGETKEAIFDIQDRIASTIVRRLNIELSEGDKSHLEKRPTSSPEAYDLYLKGNNAQWISQDGVLRAVSFYLEAVQKDPAFALAYVALARCYKDLAFIYEIWPKEKGYKLSKEALVRAFALDNENGEAFAIRASLEFYYGGDAAGADRDYQRALQLSPRNPAILRDFFWYLITKGRMEEALTEAKVLGEANPLDPTGYLILGIAYYCLRRYDDSIDAYQKSLAFDPEYFGAHGWSVYTYLAQGQYKKARDAAKNLEHQSQDNYLFVMALIEGSSGNREEAEKYRKAFNDYGRVEYKQSVAGNYNSAIYAALGDRDRTLENLNKHLVENPNAPVQYLFWHFFDKYRSDPEFIAFFKKVGFEMR